MPNLLGKNVQLLAGLLQIRTSQIVISNTSEGINQGAGGPIAAFFLWRKQVIHAIEKFKRWRIK
jgi:hypothetical protein